MSGTRRVGTPAGAALPGPADGTGRGADERLHVDPVACDGIGMCARLTAAVRLDEWGYPVVGPLRPDQVASAGRAVRACPRKALWIEHGGTVAGGG
ncbi:ferredoxin [Cellulomonas soli]|uniref:ferredoxin n=1 Tax=Cellulomonas soli TaxID=931535 RepID=UPI003F851274